MVAQVYLYHRIKRQLATLGGQANAPAIAAQRAKSIIDGLIQGENSANFGRMQPKSDKRVKNSLKFNLGSGFRLICIREKSCIYVMFAGDHDSCDAWLDHHAKKKPHKKKSDMTVFEVNNICAASAGHMGQTRLLTPNETRFDDPCLMDISQDDLRRVFRGLIAG